MRVVYDTNILIKIDGIMRVVKGDKDGDKFIECACVSNADCIVSGDRHLLDLKSYKEIEILSARAFLRRLLKPCL